MKEVTSKSEDPNNLLADLASLGVIKERVKMSIWNPDSPRPEVILHFPNLDKIRTPIKENVILEALYRYSRSKSFQWEMASKYQHFEKNALIQICRDREGPILFPSLKLFAKKLLITYFSSYYDLQMTITIYVDGVIYFRLSSADLFHPEPIGSKLELLNPNDTVHSPEYVKEIQFIMFIMGNGGKPNKLF